MSQIIFVNRYFYPDLSATSQILTDLTFHLAAEATDVTVVTGRQHYTDADASLKPRETIHGVKVVRVATTGFGRMRLLGRAMDYLSFYISAFSNLLWLVRKGDVVIAKTDPPLMSVVAALAVRLKGGRQVNWLQDLFPEVAMVLEPGVLKGPVARLAKWARDWSLRRSEANVVLGEIMSRRVRALGIPEERVLIIPNWADDRTIKPWSHERNPLRSDWGLNDKFVVAYSGNLGRAHEFQTILEAARLLKRQPDIVFLFIGGGARLDDVRQFVAEHELKNVIEKPYQPRGLLPFSLAAGDLHLLSLIPELEGLIVPSKFYGIAAAERAMAFIGDVNGEIARLVRESDCGGCFAVGDAGGLADFVRYLSKNRKECTRLGHNARLALEAEWSQDKAFERWRNLLLRLQKPNY